MGVQAFITMLSEDSLRVISMMWGWRGWLSSPTHHFSQVYLTARWGQTSSNSDQSDNEMGESAPSEPVAGFTTPIRAYPTPYSIAFTCSPDQRPYNMSRESKLILQVPAACRHVRPIGHLNASCWKLATVVYIISHLLWILKKVACWQAGTCCRIWCTTPHRCWRP